MKITEYLAARGSQQGPLFLCANGTPLSWPRPVAELRAALKVVGTCVGLLIFMS